MEYHNFLLGLITASSIIFALVIYMITQIKEQKNLLQTEYDDYGKLLTKFCQLCCFVRHDKGFWAYEKRIKEQNIALDITYDVQFFAKIVEHCAILENVKVDYLFDDLEKYKNSANWMWQVLIDKNNKDLKIDAYLSHPIPYFSKNKFSKLVSVLSFGDDIDSDHFCLNSVGDIAENVEIEVIDQMIDLSYKIKKQNNQHKKLVCFSQGLFFVSIFLPLVLLLFSPCDCIFYICIILLIVFLLFVYIIFCMLQDKDLFFIKLLEKKS